MKLQILISLIAMFIFSGNSLAHEEKKHKDGDKETVKIVFPPEQLALINQRYIREIKPIMKKKCFDCHGSGNKLPWYASIPGPSHLIQWDIKNAKKHIDISNDFPFKSHETPNKDLEAMIKEIKEEEMPPLRYLLMHWGGRLNDKEKKLILDWASDSLKMLVPKPDQAL